MKTSSKQILFSTLTSYYAFCYCFSHQIFCHMIFFLVYIYIHSIFYSSNGSLWRRANARNVRLRFPYREYTNLFIFRFVSQHCLRRTLHFMFLSDEGPTFKTLDFTFYIGSTPTFLYFDLYFNTAYAAHYILCFSLTKGLRSKC